MTRDDAINLIIGLEGGYVDDPHDPGGETKYGISKRAHPSENIADLTVDQAKQIYRDHYWNPTAARLAEHAPRLAVMVFDTAVNQGPRAAVELLQGVVSTTADGVIGPVTIAALQSKIVAHGESDLIMRYAADRAMRYTRGRGWDRYGRGWMRRLMTVLMRVSETVETHDMTIADVRATVNAALDLLEART